MEYTQNGVLIQSEVAYRHFWHLYRDCNDHVCIKLKFVVVAAADGGLRPLPHQTLTAADAAAVFVVSFLSLSPFLTLRVK